MLASSQLVAIPITDPNPTYTYFMLCKKKGEEHYKYKTAKDHNKLELIPFDVLLVIRLSKRWDLGVFKDARLKESKEKVALFFPKENISTNSEEILKLNRLSHENIIKFYGITYDRENQTEMIVLQLPAENLCEYLTKNSKQIEQTDKLNIANDVTSGLEFLHKNNIVHGDLHSRNIFIDNNKRALITNPKIFTVINGHSSMDLLRNKNKICYIDTRLLKNSHKQPDKKSDIYSLAVVMWRIFSDKEPFSNYENNLISLIHEILLQNIREEPTEDTPEKYIAIYTKCWSSDLKNRLTTSDILSELSKGSWQAGEASFFLASQIWARLLPCQLANHPKWVASREVAVRRQPSY
ncbi:6177_t:CDS:2 [Cetraspora pellucida]|uniref:6177_t:CDS:1 n=1 Tax=Cetraspora pellucida TaxID=1433469 RepID=A0A9N9AZ87_9GLOM|nr:6177_t:CDS:2 [Cetraspora pellucida]